MSSDDKDGLDEEVEIDVARRLLRRLIQTQGVNLQDLDKQFGYTRGYVSRLLHGATRLNYQHILRILRAIDVDPSLYFATLHPVRPVRRPAEAKRLEELRSLVDRLGRLLPSAAEIEILSPTPSADEDIETRIDEAVRTVLARRRTRRAPRQDQS